MARWASIANSGLWIVRCPTHGHISKTKQDRPVVATEHYIHVGTINSVAAFGSSPTCPPGEIFWFQFQMLKNIFKY